MSAVGFIKKIAAIAGAIDRADRAWVSSITLVRLVDGEYTYTATCTGHGEPREFPSYEEASDWVARLRDLSRAEAVLRELEALA